MEIIFSKPEKTSPELEEEYTKMEIEEQMNHIDLKKIKKNLKNRIKKKKLSRVVLNRRFQKLQQLIEEGDYFSEESIKERNPLLYQLYVGRYITNGGENELNGSLTNFLTNQSLRSAYRHKIEDYLERYPYMSEDLENVDTTLEGVELEDAEDELIVLMHHSFLAGLDELFVNYKEIDNDESLDDQKTIDDDQEEIYFMDKDNSDYSDGHYSKGESDYTGILDY